MMHHKQPKITRLLLSRTKRFKGFLKWLFRRKRGQKNDQSPHDGAHEGEPNKQTRNSRQIPDFHEREIAHLQGTCDKLLEEHRQLKLENQQLQGQVSRPSSNRLGIRPYRTNFTRNDAQNAFDQLMRNIDVWVENYTDKFMGDENFTENWVNSLKKNSDKVIRFQKLIQCESNRDLLSAVGYPDSDQNIVSACIVRFIWQKVLKEIPCGIPPHFVAMLKELELAMSSCTAPKLDTCAIHTWRAQSYHALFSHPDYSGTRQSSINALTEELEQILGFLSDPSRHDEFVRSISSRIIEPSLKLYEKFQTSHEKYSIETAQWIKPGPLMTQNLANEAVEEFLSNLYCVNVVGYNEVILVDELDPKPTNEELRKHLHFVCSTRPALKFCARHRAPWHVDYTCDEYDKFLTNPNFLSGAQLRASTEYELAKQDECLEELIKEADNLFAQSLMNEKQASEARLQAELERKERERRLAEEEARRKRELEEARQLQERKRWEEDQTRARLPILTKPCPGCRIPIEKNRGCDHMHCRECGLHYYWSMA
ncbi:hypothetical protein F5Y03DRAFT_400225 [Xylaria venustula]|nr:hypothetical protein F5Y03DRAFT_400225 [Xylaria venustula]